MVALLTYQSFDYQFFCLFESFPLLTALITYRTYLHITYPLFISIESKRKKRVKNFKQQATVPFKKTHFLKSVKY